MSLQDYQSAKVLIEETGGDLEGLKSEALVASAEQALGMKFPPSYRRFLLELGCGDIAGLEIFGLIDENFEDSAVPNGIWLTLNERQNTELDHAYILIGDGGDGTYYAIDTRSADKFGENPVVRLSVDGAQAESIASSFGSYLLESVQSVKK